MAITKLTKHNSHQIRVHLTKPGSKHYAALRCVECDTHVQWLKIAEAKLLESEGVSIRHYWTNQ